MGDRGLHQVNASIPCDDGLKHHKTPGGGEAFHLEHGARVPPACSTSRWLLRPCIHGASFNDGLSPEEAEVVRSNKAKRSGRRSKLSCEVYQHRICLRAKVFLSSTSWHPAHDGFWADVRAPRPLLEVCSKKVNCGWFRSPARPAMRSGFRIN